MGECECRCLNTSSTRSRWPSAAVKQTSKRNRSSYRYVNPLLLFLCRNFRHFPRFQSPRPLLAPKKKKKGGGEGERVSCDLCSSLHNTQNAVSRTCSAKTSPSSTMINVFPAESTRRRFDLVFTRVHALHGCDNGPYRGYCHCDVHRGVETERGYIIKKICPPFASVREERVCPQIGLRGMAEWTHLPNDPPSKNIALSSQRCILVMIAMTPTAMGP